MGSAISGLPLAGLALLGLSAAPAAAQDANYWTIQYGPVAQLLGGQVMGSTRDLSATYYNPGGLALAKQPAFLLSVQSVLLQGVSVTPNEGLLPRPRTGPWVSPRRSSPAPSRRAGSGRGPASPSPS